MGSEARPPKSARQEEETVIKQIALRLRGLDKWLPAVWLLTNCKNGVSSPVRVNLTLHVGFGVIDDLMRVFFSEPVVRLPEAVRFKEPIERPRAL